MAASDSGIMATISCSIGDLDAALGPRVSAMVVSGAITPPRRGVATQEDPQHLTSRALVVPMMRTLGYTDVTEIRRDMGRVPGMVIAVTAANHPLSEASENLLRTMRGEGVRSGIATDGIRWVRAETWGRWPKVVCMADLRPYYVEALDRDRFRAAVPEDRRNLRLFSSVFSRPD